MNKSIILLSIFALALCAIEKENTIQTNFLSESIENLSSDNSLDEIESLQAEIEN